MLVVLQVRARRFHPFSTLLLACVLGVQGLWYRSQGTVSVNTVNTPKVETFCWATITFFADPGNRAGILDGGRHGLGYLGAALVFSAALAIFAFCYFRTRLSHVLLFWAAFILTRPLGATIGDFLDKPLNDGGLAAARSPPQSWRWSSDLCRADTATCRATPRGSLRRIGVSH